jgi:hypothetical protein
MQIRVECYAGYRAEETPRAFFLGERQIAIIDIIDRWLAPEHRFFKVQGDDDGVYILRHDSLSGRWEMILFANGQMRDWTQATNTPLHLSRKA